MPGWRWGPFAGRMDVREVESPLLPPRRQQVGPDKGQQALAVAGRALARQHFGLVHAVDRAVRGEPAVDDSRKGWKNSIRRTLRTKCYRGDVPGPTNKAEGPDRALGRFASSRGKDRSCPYPACPDCPSRGRSRLADHCPTQKREACRRRRPILSARRVSAPRDSRPPSSRRRIGRSGTCRRTASRGDAENAPSRTEGRGKRACLRPSVVS